jgi:molecular chaperone DnaJ
MSEIPRNLYEVLQVGRNASETDIRRAYIRLATKFHPQVNPNDSTAAENFAKVQKAFLQNH